MESKMSDKTEEPWRAACLSTEQFACKLQQTELMWPLIATKEYHKKYFRFITYLTYLADPY